MPTQKSIISASEGLGSGYALSRESAATPFMAAKRRSVFDSQGQAMTQWSGLAAKILPCAWWRHQCLISTHIFLLCVFMLSLIFLYCCYIISKKWKKTVLSQVKDGQSVSLLPQLHLAWCQMDIQIFPPKTNPSTAVDSDGWNHRVEPVFLPRFLFASSNQQFPNGESGFFDIMVITVILLVSWCTVLCN